MSLIRPSPSRITFSSLMSRWTTRALVCRKWTAEAIWDRGVSDLANGSVSMTRIED